MRAENISFYLKMSANIDAWETCWKNVWTKINEIIGSSVPKCIAHILFQCGYDTILSLKHFPRENPQKDASIESIESHIETRAKEVMKNFDCLQENCPCIAYKQQAKFTLLPGHKSYIVGLSKELNSANANVNTSKDLTEAIGTHEFSPVLEALIDSEIKNSKKVNPGHRFSDLIIDFSIYLYLLSGRYCYNFLHKNLSILADSTVRE